MKSEQFGKRWPRNLTMTSIEFTTIWSAGRRNPGGHVFRCPDERRRQAHCQFRPSAAPNRPLTNPYPRALRRLDENRKPFGTFVHVLCLLLGRGALGFWTLLFLACSKNLALMHGVHNAFGL